jgi:predicted transcriptional regulator
VSEKKTKRIIVRLSDTLKKRLDDAAKKSDTEAARIVRDAIQEKLDSNK